MTIASTQVRQAYTGDGTTVNFPFAPYVLEEEDLIVILTDNTGDVNQGVETILTLGTDYNVSGVAAPNGTFPNGVLVTMVVAPLHNYVLTIIRDPVEYQDWTANDNDALPVLPLETQLDDATMQIQRLRDMINNALAKPDGYPIPFSMQLPGVIPANSLIVVNSSGNGFIMQTPAEVFASLADLYLQIDNNLSDVANPLQALDNITPAKVKGMILTSDGTNITAQGTSGNVNGWVPTWNSAAANGWQWAAIPFPATPTFDSLSPLTTKGDMLGYSTHNVRVAGPLVDGWVPTSLAASPVGWAWAPSSGGGGTPYQEVPAGTVNGSNTVFGPLANNPASAAAVDVYLDGLIQILGTDFTFNTGTNEITFAVAPATGQSVYCVYSAGDAQLGSTPVVEASRIITSTEITNKQLFLAYTPIDSTQVIFTIAGLNEQFRGYDFTCTGDVLSWSGYSLDGVIETGDIANIQYFR